MNKNVKKFETKKEVNMTKKKTGRPSKYRPEYCQKLIDHMSEGLSYETFGATIGVCKSTVYLWEENEEFSEAKSVAWQLYQLFWERMGVYGSKGDLKGFNSTSYIYNMKCRFRKSDTFGNDPDSNIKVTITPERVSELSEKELDERLAEALIAMEKKKDGD